MSKEKHVNIMIDIETAGLTPGSSILSIGATLFGECEHLPKGVHPFEACISRESNGGWGLLESQETLIWWYKQPNEALRKAIGGEERLELALTRLSDWVRNVQVNLAANTKITFWCKQNNFDFALLEAAYTACNLTSLIPWNFREIRDFRTLLDVAHRFDLLAHMDEEVERKKHLAHDALADATYQSKIAAEILERLVRFTTNRRGEDE